MRIEESEGRLVLRDAPGLHWLLAAIFLCVGGLFAACPLGLCVNPGKVPTPAKVTFFLAGCIGVAVGVYVARTSPLSVSTFDRLQGRLVVRRWGLLGRSTAEALLHQIQAVQVVEKQDSEGDPVYRVELRLRSGQPLLPSLLWVHDKAGSERAAEAMRAILRRCEPSMCR